MNTNETQFDQTATLQRTCQERLVDTVDKIAVFHEDLADYFEDMTNVVERPTVALLLNFMASHERVLSECLHAYVDNAPHKVLERWFKDVPEVPTDELFRRIEVTSDMSIEELCEMVMRIDRALQKIYTPLAGASITKDLQEALQALQKMESDHAVQAMRAGVLE